MANAKTLAQRWCERLSPLAGAAIGVGVGAALVWYWSARAEGTMLLNIPLALLVGFSIATTLWAVGIFWLAPLPASPETKAVLRSVRITKYDPFHQILEISFMNEVAAELTARENPPILIPERDDLRAFQISAHILAHDIRYSNSLATQVLLDHYPGEEEALALLQPVIDKVMIQQLAEGTFYDVDGFEIKDLGPLQRKDQMSA
jgi:hypothetical protein